MSRKLSRCDAMFPRIDKGPIEYTLDIRHAYNNVKKKVCVRFSIRTVEEFHHFRYEITVDHRLEGHRIEIDMRGLRTRGMLLPASGHAEATIDVCDLDGRYTVAISKPGPITNEFTINVTGNRVILVTDVGKRAAFIGVETN